MSGGVDSSVAAVLLKKEGYEVIGITMKTWDYESSGRHSKKQIGCCNLESMNDARSVALKYDFTHFVIDIRKEFGDWVIDHFTSEYLAGRTPNPCVLCNTHIKWAALLRRADDLGCSHIATGHYARVRHESEKSILMKGVDVSKDQSYALWGVQQQHLRRTIFPLGDLAKTEIREMATDFGLDRVAQKPDSYEICFVPDDDYRRFLRHRVPEKIEKIGKGNFVGTDGSVLGEHEGYPFYTIGQRHGLGLALGEPVYVAHIDPTTNTILIGTEKDLMKNKAVAHQINLLKYDQLATDIRGFGKVRYNDPGAECLIRQTGEDELQALFYAPRKSVTPGQALVLYEDDDVIGGGWLSDVPAPAIQPY